ncbi:hypothetical protein [Arachnia propionica]|uniref:hypothetical protein n=1 Tax=Arachnia propionica TaxID=1750 RepID=UPI00163ACECB|nr:hypothetical protein [Arachnia propionica]
MNPLPATLNEAYLAIHEADAHARAAEVALMVGIAKAAELYEVDDAAVMEAVEGFLEPGGDGTPSVGEFLAHELGGILQISPEAALEKIGIVREGARVGGSLRGSVWWPLGKADDEERTGSCVRGGQRCQGVTGAAAVDSPIRVPSPMYASDSPRCGRPSCQGRFAGGRLPRWSIGQPSPS